MIEAIAFIDTATSRARAAGIPGINQDQRYTCPSCFVVDKLTQLKERPAMQRGSLTLSNRYPSADAFEVFQGNSASSALSVSHDALADRVVHISGKTRFLLGSLIQSAFGRLSSLGLQLLAESAIAMTYIVYLRRRVHMAVGVYSNVRHSQVNAHHVSDINRLRLLNLAGGKEVELAVNQRKVSFSVSVTQKVILPGAADKGHLLTTAQTPDRNDLIWQAPVEDSVIVGNRAVLVESSSLPVIQPVGIGHLADAANHYLSRQGERGSCLSIGEFVESKLAKGLGLPSCAADGVASGIGGLQRLTQQPGLSFIRKQFDLGRQLHGLYHTTAHYQYLEEEEVCVSSTS